MLRCILLQRLNTFCRLQGTPSSIRRFARDASGGWKEESMFQLPKGRPPTKHHPWGVYMFICLLFIPALMSYPTINRSEDSIWSKRYERLSAYLFGREISAEVDNPKIDKSSETKTAMNFGVYLPPQAESGSKLPVMYWLSGLTCTEQNFITKGAFQQHAAKHGGCKIEGEDDSYDFGSGAGFYVDATEAKWATNYRMYSYVTKELPALIEANFPVDAGKQSILGHRFGCVLVSHEYMGGHGALICALKNPGRYKTVSAFSPISNPSQCPWGQKAFSGYLGADKKVWKQYDATELIQEYQGEELEILIDQGDADNFYKEKQLLPENFADMCTEELNVRMQKGYDHSFYFIATFIGDHFEHHAKHLKK